MTGEELREGLNKIPSFGVYKFCANCPYNNKKICNDWSEAINSGELCPAEVDSVINLLADKGYGKMVEKVYSSEWCPQHGYPVPCDKCGFGRKVFQPIERIKDD
jgi:hypothetical protein